VTFPKVSYTPRTIGFTTPQELTCPNGHHIKEDAFTFDDGVLRCKHREPAVGGRAQKSGGEPECGKLLYLLAGWQPRGLVPVAALSPLDLPVTTLLFTAEVTYREVRQMQEARLDVDGVLRFLGVRFPMTGLVTAK
jgi:hypothetical protein